MHFYKKGDTEMKKILLAVCAVCFIFTADAFSEEFSGDMVSVTAGMTMTSKIYYKNYNTSRTEAMGMVTITNGNNTYQLFDSTKKYVLMDMEEYKQQNPMADADDFESFVKNNDMKKIGTETVGEYKCDVYEGNITYDVNQAPIAMKLWYSSKLDYPVRSETQLPAPMSGTAVSTLENIEIGKQAESLFEVPDGYTQAQSVEEAMGMGGFMMPSMPSGDDSEEADEMPSQDEMNKMMQMMKDMMGGQN